jgi:hypothetical protein
VFDCEVKLQDAVPSELCYQMEFTMFLRSALNHVWHVDVEVNKDIADIVIRNNQNERYVLELVAHTQEQMI